MTVQDQADQQAIAGDWAAVITWLKGAACAAMRPGPGMETIRLQ